MKITILKFFPFRIGLWILLFLFSESLHAQWNSIPSNIPKGQIITGIRFTDRMNGHCIAAAGGKSPMIYKTSDGGKNWQIGKTFAALLDYPNAISFPDKNTGYVGASENDQSFGVVYKTTDGGSHWKEDTLSGSTVIYGISFHDAMHGVASGLTISMSKENGIITFHDTGYLAFTTDGGDSWKKVNSQDVASLFLFVTLADQTTGYVLGTGIHSPSLYRTSQIQKTTDGGNSWNIIHAFPDSMVITACWFKDATTGCATAYIADSISIHRGLIIKTTDGGVTWKEKPIDIPIKDNGLYDLTFTPGMETGYAVGDNTTLLRSTDGGESWHGNSTNNPLALEQLLTVSTYSDGSGIAAGNSGVFYTTGGSQNSVSGENRQSLQLWNFPNPATQSTTIHYQIDTDSHVTISLSDLLGRITRVVVSDMEKRGEHDVTFNTESIPSGIYECHLQSGNTLQTSMIVVAR